MKKPLHSWFAGLIILVPALAFGQVVVFEGTYAATAPTGPGSGLVEVVIDLAGNTGTYTSTFDGPVFDVTAPPEISYTMNGTLSGDTWTFSDVGHPIFGDSVLTINNTTGAMMGTSTNVPSGGLSLVMDGVGTVTGLTPGNSLDMTFDLEDTANPGISVGNGMLNAIAVALPIDIPTLGTWSQVVLAGLLLVVSLGFLRRTVAT
jgi:hypothetical protein